MRRTVLVVMTFLLLISLMPAVQAAEEKPITLTWWINPWRIAPPGFPDDEAPGLEDFPQWAAEEFQRMHPNVTIEFEIVPNQGYDEKITAAILSGNPPDVLRPLGIKQQWLQQGLLEPIDDYLTEDDFADFYDYALAEGHYQGQHYLFPWANSNNGMGSTLLLNPSVFADRGVAMPSLPERSWTMDEFMEAARKLSYDKTGDGINDVYAIGMSATMDIMNNAAWLHVFGGSYVDEEARTFTANSPESVEALQWMVDAVHKERIAPPGAEGMDIYDVIGMFHQERLAIGYGGPYEIGRIDRYVKEGQLEEAFPVHIAQFPHFPDIGPVAYHTSTGFVVFKQTDPYKRQMAMEFARFLTNKENMALLRSLLYVTTRASVNETLYKGYEFEDEVDVYMRAVENGIRYFGSSELSTDQADQYFKAALEAAFAQDKTPQQALDEFVASANRVIFRGR